MTLRMPDACAILSERPDERYAMIEARDASCDGGFFYGVRTTRVFCRPTCRSRLPLRHNVVYFTSAAQARVAGYRACKRCRPESANAGDARRTAMQNVCRQIEGADAVPTLRELAASAGLSPAHLQRTFSRIVGVSPRRYAAAVRERRLRDALRSEGAVTRAIYDAGFGSSSGAYAQNELGMSPTRYRRGARGVEVAYAVVDSVLGAVLVAATGRGICSVRLGSNASDLEREIRSEYPNARIARDDGLTSVTSAVVRYLAGDGRWPQLPLDLRATAFQARVWDALRRIAPGSTTTYSELARALGDERSTRAVARAIASNPIALLVPCHRVVRKGGGLGGYRWGIERKRALLDLERTRENLKR